MHSGSCSAPASGEHVHTSRKTVTWTKLPQCRKILTGHLGLLVKDTGARTTVEESTFDTAPDGLTRCPGRQEAFPRYEDAPSFSASWISGRSTTIALLNRQGGPVLEPGTEFAEVMNETFRVTSTLGFEHRHG